MIVKAFMIRPRIALLDEPTASLDPDVAKEVVDFVREQRKEQGTAILYTSHNMAEVAEVCDRVLFMQQGKIVADDLPDNLAKSVLRSQLRLQVSEWLPKTEQLAQQLSLPYVIDHHAIELELDEQQIASFLSALAQAGVIYTQISIRPPTLEDYFLHMTLKGKRR
jgi:ABC-2 type transport system ATP-binding protein